MSQTHHFSLAMTCDGCANAARRVLAKLGDQVKDVQIDVAAKKVDVTTDLSQEEILKVLEKTGKEVRAL
ncbi:Metal homeostasis factor ATX1-like [Aphelenchoides besseyi]|nr:Metal homeostasis factor ATX1-like [Aphelenchoides besseyi]